MKMKSLLLVTLTTLGLIASTMAQNLPNYVPANGLVGWWPFNGNANDESGNGNNGTINGATLTTDRFGDSERAFDFNGTSDYITVNALSELNDSAEFSISAWILPQQQTVSRQFIVSRGYDYADGSFFLCYEGENGSYSNKIRGSINGYSNFNIFSYESYIIPYSNWQNIVLNKGQDSIELFVNGLMVESLPYSAALSASNYPVNFGLHLIDFFPYYFSGQLDDIGIWNRALNQQEITDLFNSNNVGINKTSEEILFSVFPNPTQNRINLKADISIIGSIYSIWDITGRFILNGNITSENTEIELNTLSEGAYVLKINDKLNKSFMIIKNK